MEKITRRTFIAQTASLAVGASALSAEGHAVWQPMATAGGNPDPRREHLEALLKILTPSKSDFTGRINAVDKNWEDWVKRTGELPPDFDALPSHPFLVDPIQGLHNPQEWKSKRKEIRAQLEQWFYGKMPPAPDNLRVVVTDTWNEGKVAVRKVRLEFGPDHRGTLRLQLMIPPGKGPFPVFLTNHPRSRPWAAVAVRRGYIGCIYSAADPYYGDADDSDKFIEVYPEYDFSCLARWAWAAMRAVDYLCTIPEVDPHKIGIAGHSRNGKQALLAAAFDERIGAVIASSGNTGECNPYLYTTEMFANESIAEITGNFPNWFHPRLRFFSGREHQLPVDQNAMMALVAPRGLMLYFAYAEHDANSVGVEQAYPSVARVYASMGDQDKFWMHQRPGEHPTTAEDDEVFCDFLDTVFGRQKFPQRVTWVHGYTFDGWKKLSGESINPATHPTRVCGDFVGRWGDATRNGILQKISWALGEEPGGVRFPARKELHGTPMTDDGVISLVLARPYRDKAMGYAPLGYGDDLKADLYYPAEANPPVSPAKWPVIVWMHPYAYPTGYSRYGRSAFRALTKRGFAVLAFDQIGFGTRVLDARNFYQRYPLWSLMGKMVADTRAAIDAVAGLDQIDGSRIYLVGYSLGAKVGLLTAATDDRIKGLAAVCGVDALRLDTAAKGTEGVKHYSHLHGLLPRLGFFVGHESRLPFDYDEVLAAIAPRPVLVVAPTLDRYAPVKDVQMEVEAAGKIYAQLGNENALQLETPLGFNSFTPAMQESVFDWLGKQV